MEAALGASFARVRIHTDAVAHDAARAVRATAFTVGEDIFFADGAFAPDTAAGAKLPAHELAHVVQAREGRTARGTCTHVAAVAAPHEREAHAIAARAIEAPAARSAPPRPSPPPSRTALLRRPPRT